MVKIPEEKKQNQDFRTGRIKDNNMIIFLMDQERILPIILIYY